MNRIGLYFIGLFIFLIGLTNIWSVERTTPSNLLEIIECLLFLKYQLITNFDVNVEQKIQQKCVNFDGNNGMD